MDITLTMRQQKRIEIIEKVLRNDLTVVQAAMVLGVSERQCYRVLNNGVTVVADRGSFVARDLTLENVQIVNGLQTSRSIYNYLTTKGTDGEKWSVLLKIIIKDDAAAIDKIIKASNFQTPIPLSSLKATDEFQRKIEDYLKRYDLLRSQRVP